jgi:hypothetical protein
MGRDVGRFFFTVYSVAPGSHGSRECYLGLWTSVENLRPTRRVDSAASGRGSATDHRPLCTRPCQGRYGRFDPVSRLDIRAVVVRRKYLRNGALAGRERRQFARCSFAIVIAIFSVRNGLAIEKHACGAQLEVAPNRKSLPLHLGHLVDSKDLHVVIRNTGGKSLDLVLPGDGSLGGMRTPIVIWTVRGSDGSVNQTGIHVDATIEPLRPGEVIRLQSGETRELTEWIPPIEIFAAGTYKISLRYTNDPYREWASVYRPPRRILSPFPSFRDHDSAEMKRVRTSTPCDLKSAPVEIVVVPE